MFTAALFTIAKLWNQTRYPQTDKGIKKMWYMEYIILLYTIILSHKGKKMVSFAIKWMELEIIMLNEIIQTQKDKYCIL
jgi:hypothetical protein